MNRYKVLLVDDENEIREGMAKKIPWTELGFELSGQAENGIDALEKAEQIMPDVVMTDIRMPFMDGLSFIEKTFAFLPDAKIIVFSGFDDFEYAQKAIGLGVEEYILKPVSGKQMEETLAKLKRKLDQEREHRTDMELLRKTYQESYPVLREQFLTSIIKGYFTEEQIHRIKAQYHFKLESPNYTVVVFTRGKNKKGGVLGQAFEGREELIPISIQSLAGEIAGRYQEYYCFQHLNQIVLIIALPGEGRIPALYQDVNGICQKSRQITGASVTAGIGGIYDRVSDLKYAYMEADNALNYSMLFSKEGKYTAYIRDVEPESITVRLQLEEVEEKVFSNAVKNNEREAMAEILHGFFEKMEQPRLSFYQYQTYIIEIFTSVMKLIRAYQLDPVEVFGKGDYMNEILNVDSLDTVEKYLLDACERIGELLQRGRADSGKALVEKAKQIAQDKYTEPGLSLEELCSELHISPGYFSTLFKKETGLSFISWLTRLRTEQAKMLLDSTDDKTYMIAEKVGYSEPNYFSYVFKKETGMSPSNYRKRMNQ